MFDCWVNQVTRLFIWYVLIKLGSYGKGVEEMSFLKARAQTTWRNPFLCVNLYDFTSNDDDFELLRKGYKPANTMVNNFQEWQKSELHTIRWFLLSSCPFIVDLRCTCNKTFKRWTSNQCFLRMFRIMSQLYYTGILHRANWPNLRDQFKLAIITMAVGLCTAWHNSRCSVTQLNHAKPCSAVLAWHH